MKIGAVTLAFLLAGCLGMDSGSECTPTKEIVYVNKTDTLYMTPPSLGAPVITSLKTRQSEGQDGKLHYYIDADWSEVRAAIGYKVYWSTKKDSTYSAMTTGTFYGSSKLGMFTYTSGTLFFKVAPINNDGIEGAWSPHAAVVYDGVQ